MQLQELPQHRVAAAAIAPRDVRIALRRRADSPGRKSAKNSCRRWLNNYRKTSSLQTNLQPYDGRKTTERLAPCCQIYSLQPCQGCQNSQCILPFISTRLGWRPPHPEAWHVDCCCVQRFSYGPLVSLDSLKGSELWAPVLKVVCHGIVL